MKKLSDIAPRRLCFVVVLFFHAVLGTSCVRERPPDVDRDIYVEVEEARRSPIADRILTMSQVEAGQWQPVYFGQPGRVARVYVEENQPVTKGQLLAEQESDVQKNQVEQMAVALEKAKMDEEQARHDYENAKALLASGGVSEEQVRDQKERYLEAKLQREQSELRLAREKLKLEDHRLRAPFDGIVMEVNIHDGDLVVGPVSDPDRDRNMRPPIVVMDPSSHRTLRAHVPEGQARQIVKGTLAVITLMENRDIVLDGKVSRVSETVDRDTRTVNIQVDILEPEGGYPSALRDGSAALVSFLTNRREDAITVSEYALYYYQNKAYVFVVNPSNKVERREVQLGLFQDGRVEILSGLKAGERVARSHLFLLKDGQSVEIGSRS